VIIACGRPITDDFPDLEIRIMVGLSLYPHRLAMALYDVCHVLGSPKEFQSAARGRWIDDCGATVAYNPLLKAVRRHLGGSSLAECFGGWVAFHALCED
jgi:hypothetical protein